MAATGSTGSGATSGTTSGGNCVVTTVAGSGQTGFVDGAGDEAEFFYPAGVVLDSQGNLVVADLGNAALRKVDPQGNVTTFGPVGTYEPQALAIDAAGSIYVADIANHCVWKVDLGGTATVLAGNGTVAFADGTGGPDGTAAFTLPYGVSVDGTGNVDVTDIKSNRVRRIDPSGNVTTLSGNGTDAFSPGSGGATGSTEFNSPASIAVDAAGRIFVGDQDNSCVCALDSSGAMTVFAGNGQNGFHDGTGGQDGSAEFGRPEGLALDDAGNVYVSDTYNNSLRKVDPLGNVTTIAGSSSAGFADGPGPSAQFDGPWGLAVAGPGVIYVADLDNARIRKVTCP